MLTKKLIALLLSVVLLLGITACGEAPSGDNTAAIARQAVISQLSGEARILRGDGSAEKAAVGSILLSGDSVLTEEGAVATLSLDDDKTLTVSPSSEIMFSTLTEDGGTKTVILIKRGSLANSVDQKLGAGDIYEVCTGDMTMAIRGTDAYIEATPNGTVVTLLTGYAISFNYTVGKAYVVPSGISALFPPNADPSFELIDLDAYAARSEAAAAMLEKVKKDTPDFKKGFESELRESYIDDSGYSFSIAEPMAGAVPSAEITASTAEVTTTATVTTTAVSHTKPAAPTAKPTAKPTAPTPPTPPSPPTPTASPTDATSASEAAPTVPSVSPMAMASSASPTAAAPSSQPTAATTASTEAEPDAVYYDVVLTGLYYQAESGEWIPLTTGQIWSGRMENGGFTTVNYTLNGETFTFWVQCSEQMATPYDYPYFSNSYPSDYQSVKTFASATLAE